MPFSYEMYIIIWSMKSWRPQVNSKITSERQYILLKHLKHKYSNNNKKTVQFGFIKFHNKLMHNQLLFNDNTSS